MKAAMEWASSCDARSTAMALFHVKRRAASRSQAGEVARRGRQQCWPNATPRRAGAWSSMLRLTPLQGEAASATRWPSLALARLGASAPSAPVFLCTDFAPSQWWGGS